MNETLPLPPEKAVMECEYEYSIVFFGKKYNVHFHDLRQKIGQRSTGANESKEWHEAPYWSGQMTIWIPCSRKSIPLLFYTDTFWPDSVKEYSLPEILMLFVNRTGQHLFQPNIAPDKIHYLIDYWALRVLADTQTNQKNTVCIEPFKMTDERDGIIESMDIFTDQ